MPGLLQLRELNDACKRLGDALHAQLNPAGQAFKPIVPPERLRKRIERLKKSGWFDEADECMRRYKAALARPDDPRSEPWLKVVQHLPLGAAVMIGKHLAKPARKRGRPRVSKIAQDEPLFAGITALVERGEDPTPAAKKIYSARGADGDQLRDKADYAVKLWKQRNKIA